MFFNLLLSKPYPYLPFNFFTDISGQCLPLNAHVEERILACLSFLLVDYIHHVWLSVNLPDLHHASRRIWSNSYICTFRKSKEDESIDRDLCQADHSSFHLIGQIKMSYHRWESHRTRNLPWHKLFRSEYWTLLGEIPICFSLMSFNSW